MIAPAKPLTFSAVDGLGFAAASGTLEAAQQTAPYVVRSLGPLLELVYLVAGDRLPPLPGNWIVENGASPMIAALQQNHEEWVSADNRRTGFIRALRNGADCDARLVAFLMHAKKAATDVAGLPGTTPGQLAAAMGELESNIHEHSDAPATGILAYRAAPGVFEFVAADRGIGVLRSLQLCTTYADLPDHGKALQAAVSDGTSRFGANNRRGYGFRPIFLGLINLYGSLRFRSGDYALLIDGTSPQPATAQVAQKPVIDGFFASVRCHNGPGCSGGDLG